MILVLGSSGKIGGAVRQQLAARGVLIRCLVRRSPAPGRAAGDAAEVVVGDAADPGVLDRAMAGVEKIFLVMENGPRQREIELGVVAAAVRANVRHIVKVSAPIVGPAVPVAIARMHYEIEQAIEASPLAFTHLRPFGFMQNLLSLAPLIAKWDLFFGATGSALLNLIDAHDIAAVAATALTEPGSEGRAYVLTGPETFTYAQIAARLSVALGRRIRYVDQTPEAMRRGLQRQRLPEWLVHHILEIQGLAVSVPEHPNDVVQQVTGHPPRTLDTFLKDHLESFRRQRTWFDRAIGAWLARGAGG
jgi:uncharacterized protein YbjT (DUF2867 family)